MQDLFIVESNNRRKSYNGKEEYIKCKFCNLQHKPNRSECLAMGKMCYNCGKLNHFATVCRLKRLLIRPRTHYTTIVAN